MKPIPVQIYQPVMRPKPPAQQAAQPSGFNHLLKDKIFDGIPVQLTKHAKERLSERSIHFSSSKWQKIHDRMLEAKAKGLKDSLVLTREAALVVNVDNNTVITALNRKEAASHIFTNINGTILVD